MSQAPSLVGDWSWSNSKYKTLLFFKEDGRISMHIISKMGTTLDTAVTIGSYRLRDTTLTLRWEDMSEVTSTLKFIDKNTFQNIIVNMNDSTDKDVLIFRRLVSKAVALPKQ